MKCIELVNDLFNTVSSSMYKNITNAQRIEYVFSNDNKFGITFFLIRSNIIPSRTLADK